VWLVVVDGRQPGVSEGMTCHELAGLMQRLGCSDAVNLDGGGSSVMMIAAPSGALEIANRPSGKGTRPVPVMLAVKMKPDGASRD
jgi:exopolysaccharide biosynthesis protein